VTGIQHAIKNSLNALKGGSYLVLNGVTRDNRERIQEGRDMIEEGIERIGNLSRNMLDYAKEWKLELERVDLNHVVSRACEENQQAAVDQGVALRHEPSDGLPDVLGDSNLIHMAVTDILVNAIDACVWKDYPSDELPEVVAGTFPAPQDGFVAIEVRDNGCGMDDDIRQEIFTPFFSTKLVQGTGLGLALTERFVRVHGGDISVESEPDRGSAFRIHLPIDGPEDRKETVDA
jgi:signal transduction histidine kinase